RGAATAAPARAQSEIGIQLLGGFRRGSLAGFPPSGCGLERNDPPTTDLHLVRCQTAKLKIEVRGLRDPVCRAELGDRERGRKRRRRLLGNGLRLLAVRLLAGGRFTRHRISPSLFAEEAAPRAMR